jgi:hypothetical protein
MRLIIHGCLLWCVLTAGASAVAEGRSYFPETGAAAVHQRALELATNATVLMIALEPGYEDLPLAAHFRMGLGARVIVAHATYGSGTPGDAEGGTPLLISGERREEAYRAARHLGATAHFLNLQDPGILLSIDEVHGIWNADTVVARLDRALRYYRPDVVILGGDFRGDTVRSIRVKAMEDLLLKAVAFAGDQNGRPDTLRPGPWRVPRVYVESARSPRSPDETYDQKHPVWGKSYREIAGEASLHYRSLWIQRDSWTRRGDRTYALVVPTSGRTPDSYLRNLPAITPRLRPLASSIARLAAPGPRKLRAPRLAETARAIDSVDLYLARNRRDLAPGELRLLVGWKTSLEELRCSLLDVRVEYAMSESLVTSQQLVYLRFASVTATSKLTRTRVLFPGAVDHSWGINESPEYAFPFSPPQEFRVITPAVMDLTVPSSQTGIFQSSVRTRFSFLLMHQDSVRQRDFYYRGEVPLQAGPKRTFEILTPIVRSGESASVVYRMINLSRDAYEGTVSISDSLVFPAARKVRLPSKDFVLTDTLVFAPRRGFPPGDYPLTLAVTGGSSLRFALRSFDAETGPAAQVAVLSPTTDSPLMQGMTRLGIRWQSLDPSGELPRGGTIVLDRDAASLKAARTAMPPILEWVRAGGHLVMLPQTGSNPAEGPLFQDAMFRSDPQLPPGAALEIDTAQRVFASPNRVTTSDWEGWVVSRSLYSIVLPADRQAHVLVRSADGRRPILVEIPYGNGRVTMVALDLVSQLANVHPGSHRLLANILAP